MKFTFTARHFEASNSLMEFAETTIQKLNQFYGNIIGCDVILEPGPDAKQPQQAEINLRVPDKILTITVASQTYEQAIREAVENLARQLKRYKQKRQTI